MLNVKISRTNDPFKKYWWVILVFFCGIAGFVCMPSGDAASGAPTGSLDSKPGAERSLDPSGNPNGAPGSAVDLSMDGSGGYRKASGPIASSLYEAPADATTASSSTVAANRPNGGNLANALRDIAKKGGGKSASADPTGWGGEKAQKGFAAPKVGGAFNGSLGGGGGGGGSAGFSVSEGGTTAFGTGKAKTGATFARGLGGSIGADPDMKNASASMRALGAASNQGTAAASAQSGTLASALSAHSFDGGGSFTSGSAGGPTIGGGGNGTVAAGGVGGLSMNSAPMNLKANDSSKTDAKTITPAPVAPPPEPKPSMMDMIKQMLITGLVGAVMQGLVGGLL